MKNKEEDVSNYWMKETNRYWRLKEVAPDRSFWRIPLKEAMDL